MEMKGLEGMTRQQLASEIQRGGKFVIFLYTISILVVTFKRSSDVQFIKADQSAFGPGLPYTLLTLVMGWWGIPWGPIYSIQSVYTNLGGGKDVTPEVLAAMGMGDDVPAARAS